MIPYAERLIDRFKKPKGVLLEQKQINREKIDEVIATYPKNKDWAYHLPREISVLISPDLRKLNEDCERFAINSITLDEHASFRHINDFSNVHDPKEGDLVIYMDNRSPLYKAKHVGIYQKDGSVISKWGWGGPVLKHPIFFVPTSYGNSIIFSRFKNRGENNR